MEVLRPLPGERDAPALAAAVDGLLVRAGAALGDHALSEGARRARERGHVETVVVRDHPGGPVVGYGQVAAPASEGPAVAELAVDPDADAVRVVPCVLEGIADVVDAQGSAVRLWRTHAGPADDSAAAALGFTPERDLLQLRCPLPLDPTATGEAGAGPAPASTRAFRPGRDEDAWIAANNRAFSGHPEQGRWDRAVLAERMAEAWFDPDGFRVLDGPDGVDGIAAWCWTKVHRDTDPPLGEIYVIGVDPSAQGRGLGRLLAVDGLTWLAGRGLRTGMLYVHSANAAALALYASLGFTTHHVDRAYLRPGRGGA